MKQLSVKDYYDLGKQASDIETYFNSIANEVSRRLVAWKIWDFREGLSGIIQEPCALPSASQRATKSLIEQISKIVPTDFVSILNMEEDDKVQPWQLQSMKSAISRFETILGNDMPEMSTYAVSQIGIFRTDDLVNHAELQISPELLQLLKDQAKSDICESGKCLAFRISTASAFHACRAIETCIDQYFEELTGSAYAVSPKGGNNNWGAKIEALTQGNAQQKVTEFLTHIRKQYRNPVTHPEVTVDENDAKDLFVTAISAISMMLGEVNRLRKANTSLALPLVPSALIS